MSINLRDTHIFNEIYRKFQPLVFYTAYNLLKNQGDAEDVSAESFIKLWQSQPEFYSEKAIGGWLRQTTKNSCLNLIKHHKYEDSRLNKLVSPANNIENEPSNDDIIAELLTTIYNEIEALPKKRREVFKLRYINGLSNEEIALQLNINNQSVRDHLVRALKTIRISMANRGYLLAWMLFLMARKGSS